jgi:hypothetical protein
VNNFEAQRLHCLCGLVACCVLGASMSFAGSAQEKPRREAPLPASSCSLLPPPRTEDGLPAAEVVDLPPLPAPAVRIADAGSPSSYEGQALPGYKLVLAGELRRDVVLGPEHSPAAVCGVLVVPTGKTLFLKNGATLQLLPDPRAAAAAKPGSPDPRRSGVLWINGRLLADGLARAIELSAPQGSPGAIYWQGRELSELRGVRVRRVAVAQSSGVVQWLGCELSDGQHYALAGGSAFFIHCRLRRWGGVLAAYPQSSCALLVSHCIFDGCQEGLVFRESLGRHRLLVEHNSFVDARGPVLRALPCAATQPPRRLRSVPELLIGENWYGTAVPDQIDARVLDRRLEPKALLWIITRPPAERPYADAGPDVPLSTLAQTLKSLEPARSRMLQQSWVSR